MKDKRQPQKTQNFWLRKSKAMFTPFSNLNFQRTSAISAANPLPSAAPLLFSASPTSIAYKIH